MENTFEPKIVAYVCNWCTYAGADLTGTSRIKYAANVRIVRFPCTGRIDYNLLLKALALGADGIIVSGCHPNDCHYTSGNFHARRRWIVFKQMMEYMGVRYAPHKIFMGLCGRRRKMGGYRQYDRAGNSRTGTCEQ